MDKKQRRHVTLLLLNIRSVHNAGAIMRTADAIGASEVVFAGFTPTPVDRFGRLRAAFTKASLGAEKNIPWRHVDDAGMELAIQKNMRAYIVAVEQSVAAVDYKKVKLSSQPIVIVFGNEVEGIPGEICSIADIVAEIPMRGKKESLNVSVSAGIVLYRWFDV